MARGGGRDLRRARGADLRADLRSTKGMYVDEVVAYWYARHPWTGPSPDESWRACSRAWASWWRPRAGCCPGRCGPSTSPEARGPLALASSTPIALIVRCLEHFALRGRFAAIHSAEFEPYGKPHPGVFLSAAAGLGVDPTACLVIEDSAAGVLAAQGGAHDRRRRARAEDRHAPDFALADLVLDSLEELVAGVARRALRLKVLVEARRVGVAEGTRRGRTRPRPSRRSRRARAPRAGRPGLEVEPQEAEVARRAPRRRPSATPRRRVDAGRGGPRGA